MNNIGPITLPYGTPCMLTQGGVTVHRRCSR